MKVLAILAAALLANGAYTRVLGRGTHLQRLAQKCPDDDGKVRFGDNNRAYKIFCHSQNRGEHLVTKEEITSLQDCIARCDDTQKCFGGDYYADTKTCNLKGSRLTEDIIVDSSPNQNITAFFYVGNM